MGPFVDKLAGYWHKGGTAPSEGQVWGWDSTNLVFKPRFRHLSATATWNPVNLAAGAATSTTITVPGAALGDVVLVTHDQIGAQDMVITAFVQAADTVRVVLQNVSGGAIDVASGTLTALVIKVA